MSDQPVPLAEPRGVAIAAQRLGGIEVGAWGVYEIGRLFVEPESALVRVSSLLMVLSTPISFVVFVGWLRKCWSNAELLAPGTQHFSRGWAIGAWLVPVLNLWLPRRVLLDVWRASRPSSGSRLVELWWVVRLAAGAAALVMALDPGLHRPATFVAVALRVIASGLLIAVIQGITDGQVQAGQTVPEAGGLALARS